MSRPESRFESDPDYAAAYAFCDAVIETRDRINNTGTSLVRAARLEELWPGRIEELQDLAEKAANQPISGQVGLTRSARDVEGSEALEWIPPRSPAASKPRIVGAVGAVAIRDWTLPKGDLETDLLVVRIDPLVSNPEQELREYYRDFFQKRDINKFREVFGYYYPEVFSRWLRYQDIEELKPMGWHLRQTQ